MTYRFTHLRFPTMCWKTAIWRAWHVPMRSHCPAEAAALNGMIAEYSERITALDSRVVDLRELRATFLQQVSLIDEEVKHIQTEREKLSVAIDTRKKFLSPVRRLPSEILCRIFRETVDKTIPRTLSNRERNWWDFRDVPSTLWTIELVCRRWREAVISFPELWSYINVIITDDNFFMGTYRYTRLLSRQLTDELLGGMVLFDSAPKLRTIEVMDIQHPSWSFALPWKQITCFGSDHALLRNAHSSSLQILDQLRSMPNIEECHLRCEVYLNFTPEEQPQVICNKLRWLNISSRLIHQRPLFQVLSQLTAPALSGLFFDGRAFNKELDVDNTFTAIRNLMDRSHCPLTTLRFVHGLVLTEDILSIICSTPTLEELQLSHVPLEAYTRPFFDKLTIKPAVPPEEAVTLLPRLRILHLSGVMSKDFDAEGFVRMIESRCPPFTDAVTRLESVVLYRFVPPEEPDEDITQILAQLDNLRPTGVTMAIFKRAMSPAERGIW
ncbi:uncharacterized protein EV420DRAFT_1763788 [Desarmillaria tabescens]|uniref:F-box domain-containing protein n=1 Tax=Armillaria tabescens TaxID=1929756 RepID=A0AA39N6N6_ARMTA|nr:uncharacterized protein EV420DRAFT_1763788 [Desarmillaria tabescens]KAK0459378.1 hypothetical protein EV420DRAFT_1763788 [Desarmillaria tabescens]